MCKGQPNLPRYNFIESGLALAVSFVINLAIVATNASQFYNPSCAEADSGPLACIPLADEPAGGGKISCVTGGGKAGLCDEIGLDGEGGALKGALGDAALYIWAIGLLAAGQASTMTCTYAGQIIMGGCLQV